MVVHSKPVRGSPARLAGSGSACRCWREAAGTRDADLARARMTSPEKAGTGCSPHALQDRRPAYPAACPLVTLIVILPAARLRYAQAARAQSLPTLAPHLRYHNHERREARSPSMTGFSSRSPASNGRCRALARRRLAAFPYPDQRGPAASRSAAPNPGARPGGWPQDPRSPLVALPAPESLLHRALRDLWPSDPGSPAVRSGRADAARATTRHPVLRASAPAVLHGSAAGAAAPALTASSRGAAARGPRPFSVVTPGRRGWHSGVAGGSALAQTFRPGRIRQGPSMYEMEGPYPASLRQADQLAGLADAARRPPVPGTRGRGRSPGSSHVPGLAPGGARFQR